MTLHKLLVLSESQFPGLSNRIKKKSYLIGTWEDEGVNVQGQPMAMAEYSVALILLA